MDKHHFLLPDVCVSVRQPAAPRSRDSPERAKMRPGCGLHGVQVQVCAAAAAAAAAVEETLSRCVITSIITAAQHGATATREARIEGTAQKKKSGGEEGAGFVISTFEVARAVARMTRAQRLQLLLGVESGGGEGEGRKVVVVVGGGGEGSSDCFQTDL